MSAHPPRSDADRLTALERQAKTARKLLGIALIAALGSAGTAATALHDSGYDEGEVKTRLDYTERDVEQLREDLRELRRQRAASLRRDQAPAAVTSRE